MTTNFIPGKLYKVTPGFLLKTSRVINNPDGFINSHNMCYLMFIKDRAIDSAIENTFSFLNTIGVICVLYELQLNYFEFRLISK